MKSECIYIGSNFNYNFEKLYSDDTYCKIIEGLIIKYSLPPSDNKLVIE